ncbi:MAG: thioredoxin domain-containing protein [Acidilobaceae archaeon]
MVDTSCVKPNRLINSKSPYLLQHACNPVDWRPWGVEVLEEARASGKPLFISIGYSTCHWCHVMARESFSDLEVARVINEYFIPVKVDREEYPDVDSFYMTYCMATIGRCGWPLNIIATPSGEPFYVMTYVRRDDLIWILAQLANVWYSSERSNAESVAREAIGFLKMIWSPRPEDILSIDVINLAYLELYNSYDPAYGGFGRAPKFPLPHILMFLLRYWARSRDLEAAKMVFRTLDYMITGGIHDIIGGGFHRYSVDSRWLLPHFEKMLYDQALLLYVLSDAYKVCSDETYRWVSLKLIDFVNREMRDKSGGFYSAISAESEGMEGLYYTWTTSELKSIVGDDDYRIIARLFNLSDRGNYKEEHTGRFNGRNILYIGLPLREVASIHGLSLGELLDYIDKLSIRLLKARSSKPKPEVDYKILTDWNGLMMAGLAKAYQAFRVEKALDMAESLARFIESNMMIDNRLYHSFIDGEAYIDGYLSDYSYLAWGLMELYESSFNEKWLELSLNIVDSIIENFWVESSSIFRFKSKSGLTSDVIDPHDSMIPSSYSVASYVLVRASRYTGEPRYEHIAEKSIRSIGGLIKSTPSSFTFMLSTLDYIIGPSYEIVISVDSLNSEVESIISDINSRYRPNSIVLLLKSQSSKLRDLAKYTKSMIALGGKPTIYVCKNRVCDLPVTGYEGLKIVLGEAPRINKSIVDVS